MDKLRNGRIVNNDFKQEYFECMRKRCDKHSICLGVCMSRKDLQIFASGPCEGCDLELYIICNFKSIDRKGNIFYQLKMEF